MQNATQQILDVFQGFRMNPTPLDQYEQVGKSILAQKLNSFVEKGSVIEFIMLGFPFKSTNLRDKVIGNMPDLGEEATLKNFARFNESIKSVYAPGVKIGIASDGLIFNDLLKVEDKVVEQYGEISRDMGRVAPMDWFSLSDFFRVHWQTKGKRLLNCLPQLLKNWRMTF